MSVTLQSPKANPSGQWLGMNVVIACEGSMMEKTCEVWKLVERNLNGELRSVCQWRNFEDLTINSLWESSVVEAAAADLIIIGIHEWRALSELGGAWMRRWLDLRNYNPVAMVVVVDSGLEMRDALDETLSQFKQAEALGRMAFFTIQAAAESGGAVARRVSEAVRQFVLTRKHGMPQGVPGAWDDEVGGNLQNVLETKLEGRL